MGWSITNIPAWAIALFLYAVASGAAIWIGLRGRPDASGNWLDHLTELRRRIIVSIASILAVAIALFSLRVSDGGVRAAVHDSLAAQIFDAITRDLLPAGVQLVVVRPIDGFLAQMTIAFGVAMIVTAPVWVSQLVGFILPALRDKERIALRNAVAPIAALFLLGAAFSYAYVIPFLLKTLYGYGTALGAQPLIQVSEFVGFTVGMVLIMGAAFQTPVVMVALTRAGLVSAKTWRNGWRYALIGILLLSALVTDPTIVSQLMVAAPLALLYAIGVIVASLSPASR